MPQKNAVQKEMDRQIGEWKKKVLDEARSIVIADVKAVEKDIEFLIGALREYNQAEKIEHINKTLEGIAYETERVKKNWTLRAVIWCVLGAFFGTMFSNFVWIYWL